MRVADGVCMFGAIMVMVCDCEGKRVCGWMEVTGARLTENKMESRRESW